ncbi:tetratricopeptide repeat protein [Streptomyces phaeochromogenes]|uniref:tetratricopeptide repeat protein n=1 Tax=Streptomyces phaeochromogenes TaxID=1923 RepID=UPI00386DC2D9|nr:tetratricopeptide repeat-containing serine protease family protein [Streptomyces phaeochromogenes]
MVEFDRRVQIRVDRLEKGERKKGLGSGYLIAPWLVLTAAHVLDHMAPDADNPVTVTLPDTGEQEFPAVVRWKRTDHTVDAALIEIREGHGWQVPQSLGDLLTRPPQRYGLIIGTRPRRVAATGFPRMQKDVTDGRRWDEQFFGDIAPGTGSLAGRYELIGPAPTFAAADFTGRGSRWSGMSGAAVLADAGYGEDLLCGVICRDRQADRGGTRLTATPTARLLADEVFRTLITEHTGWEPVLEPVEPARLLKPAAVDRSLSSPAALLRADAEAVDFHGRDKELVDLRAWCENGPPALQVRVLTGPGGQGKTRLARRLTDTLGWRGWVTGHLRSDLTDDPAPGAVPPDFTTLATSLDLLLVVDYAETRPRLVSSLIAHLHRSRHRVRVLLLARSDGLWRTGSAEAVPAERELLVNVRPIPLAPLIPADRPARDRHDAFHRAAHGLARLLPLLDLPAHDWISLAASLRPPADLHDYRYANVLTLQMTALVGLLQHGPQPVEAAPGTPLESILLLHEKRFWKASAKVPAYELNLPAPTLGAAVAVAALCGASTQEEALRVITTLPGLPAHLTQSAAEWLASLYPPDGDRYWGSLQPDRIAEFHASHTLTKHNITLPTLPTLLGQAAPGQQAQLITVLARAAIAHYNADRPTDSEHVLRTLGEALDTAALAYQAVQTATDALPYPCRIIGPLALQLTIAIVDANQQFAEGDPPSYEPNLALLLSNLGNRLADEGYRGEALAAAEQAVEIRRRLAVGNSAATEFALADSLSNYGTHLADIGRRDEALSVAQEAIEIYDRLAAAVNPADYESALARALSSYGTHLAEMGRRDEALAVAERAVQIFDRLAVGNPAAFEHHLGILLSNLSNRLADAGRGGEALAAAERAVQIHTRLTVENPAAFEPHLARSLTNYGFRLAREGHRAKALTVAQEAVKIRYWLAAGNPAAHEPDLAYSLSGLGAHLAEMGRRDEALTVAQEAVGIHDRLAAANPAAYEPDLAHSLTVYARLLAMEGDRARALRATGEAVELFRRHVAAMPSIVPRLHAVLGLQADLLERLGREEEVEAVRRWLRENRLPPDSHS